MPTSTTAVVGWAVIAAITTTVYFVNKQRKPKNLRTVDAKQPGKLANTSVQKPKKEKAQKDSAQSSGDQSAQSASKSQKKKKKSKASAPPQLADEVDAATTTHEPVPETNGENVDDADDDQSPVSSPVVGASHAMEPLAKGNVSDMLEQTRDGASVLRVTAPTKSSESKKPTAQAAFEPAETKKQRQNRKKAEEKKAAREAEEQERRVLMEKQRRTAREAEGRAAKDGSAFLASQAPSKSAWSAPVTNGAVSNSVPPKPVELLDTYKPQGKITTESADAVAKEYAGLTEDEQLEKVKVESTEWETVPKRKIKKDVKATKDGKVTSSSEHSDHGAPAKQATGPVARQDAPVPAAVNPKPVESNIELQDAEWDVS